MTVAIADPLIGVIIGGRYEVVRKLAKGGMGMIYEVRNTKLGRNFALKTLTADAAQDPEVLARFRREADVVATLTHPNIVEVVDWDQLDDGAPYLVMEMLRGETLAKRIEAIGALPWPQIARIADQTLSALSVAHNAGVIHRDLKPDNIFLATDDAGEERVKLLDFGISKIRDSQTFATTDAKMLGTPAYMAPEQAEGQHDRIGPATDVWAIGAIIYEMVTGEVAFAAPSTPAILYRVCHGRPTPAPELRPDLPVELGELLDWALDPQLRLDDVDELRDELRRVFGKLEGVTWAAPMKSRTHESLRRMTPPVGFPRLSTPAPVGPAVTRARLASVPAPTPVTTPAPPVATIERFATATERGQATMAPRARWPFAVGGGIVVVAAAAVAFVLVRGGREPSEPAAVDKPAIASIDAPVPAPTPPATVAMVDVAIESEPSGAEVYRMPTELKVGITPYTTRLEHADGVAVFLVKQAGYRDTRVEVDLRAGGKTTAKLDKLVTAPVRDRGKPPTIKKPPGRQRGEPVNPFEKGN